MSTPTPTPAAPEPEFNAEQNALIRDLANAMTWVCIPLIVVGVVYLIGGIQILAEAFSRPHLWRYVLFVLVGGLFPLLMGMWTKRAAESFERITDTSGQDMTHLMNALRNLRNLYGVLRAFVIAYVVVVVLALIVGLITYFTIRPSA